MISLKRFAFGLILISALLAGCAGADDPGAQSTATPYPTPEIVRVSYASALRPALPAVQTCAGALPGLALLLYEVPAGSEAPEGLRLWSGEPPRSAAAYTLGEERLAVITHPGLELESLSAEQLRLVFGGKAQTWAEVAGQIEDTDLPIQVWTYPPGNELRSAFYQAIAGGELANGFARLAPDPAAMLAALAEDPGGIGYLPAAWLTAGVKQVSLERALLPALRLPLTVWTKGELSWGEQALIACLQSGAGRKMLEQVYP